MDHENTKKATQRSFHKLDAKYEKADLPRIVQENCSQSSVTERKPLLELLQKYGELFDGTLGEWKGESPRALYRCRSKAI